MDTGEGQKRHHFATSRWVSEQRGVLAVQRTTLLTTALIRHDSGARLVPMGVHRPDGQTK